MLWSGSREEIHVARRLALARLEALLDVVLI
jgi:hypothetical protein